MKCVEKVKITIFILTDTWLRIMLQDFADASEAAYGAVVYLQCFYQNNSAKLVQKIRSSLRLDISDIVLHTDSTIALEWLNPPTNHLKTFIAKGVSKVQRLTEDCHWSHVPSPLNPADLIPRGLSTLDLPELKLWWNGPSFLERGELSSELESPLKNEYEYSRELKTGVDPEMPISSVCVSTNCDMSFLSDLLCISINYVKILRIFRYVIRFVNNVKKSNVIVSGPLCASVLDQAENRLIRMVQGEVFSAEIRNLQCQKSVLPNSKLRNLNPFLDSDEVLRVCGGLGNSDLPYVTKYPAILPNKHKCTNQIIIYFHLKNLHIGACSLLHCVRERFWPQNGLSLSRKIVYECIVCFKARPIVTSQLMGNLSQDRIVPGYPFNCSSVDFCDPFMIRYRNQRKGVLHKMYICMFVCFVSKAVHIKIVSDLTSEAYIATLKRFFGRRGKCEKLYKSGN
ncbi:hypothetical protein AVEN_63007-1 [Araneus ventricosus]|uniref:Integrase zinc-binding domain-containing protein n=1 Tax=Araneus ventricosus TaxID=182803 RepID=A0A4Y2CU21_ARAVE|nr:hypothetical protein AVEN_63007-1 [Araneus ventricosus]